MDEKTPPPGTPGLRAAAYALVNEVTLALVELMKVRSIITIMIIGVMSYLAMKDQIKPETFMAVAASVVTYYFTRKEQG